MREAIGIHGAMQLVPCSKSLHIKTLLNYTSIEPFKTLITFDEGEGSCCVVVTPNDDETMSLTISGWFYELAYSLGEYIRKLIDMGFKVYGAYEIYTSGPDAWSCVIRGFGDRIEEIMSKPTSRQEIHRLDCSITNKKGGVASCKSI